ncbi:hypothetical protein CBL_01109 [Carabus blaptoides fortunei]
MVVVRQTERARVDTISCLTRCVTIDKASEGWNINSTWWPCDYAVLAAEISCERCSLMLVPASQLCVPTYLVQPSRSCKEKKLQSEFRIQLRGRKCNPTSEFLKSPSRSLHDNNDIHTFLISAPEITKDSDSVYKHSHHVDDLKDFVMKFKIQSYRRPTSSVIMIVQSICGASNQLGPLRKGTPSRLDESKQRLQVHRVFGVELGVRIQSFMCETKGIRSLFICGPRSWCMGLLHGTNRHQPAAEHDLNQGDKVRIYVRDWARPPEIRRGRYVTSFFAPFAPRGTALDSIPLTCYLRLCSVTDSRVLTRSLRFPPLDQANTRGRCKSVIMLITSALLKKKVIYRPAARYRTAGKGEMVL